SNDGANHVDERYYDNHDLLVHDLDELVDVVHIDQRDDHVHLLDERTDIYDLDLLLHHLVDRIHVYDVFHDVDLDDVQQLDELDRAYVDHHDLDQHHRARRHHHDHRADAEHPADTRRARSAVRSGLQLLDAAAQRVRAAEGRHLIATDCGRTLRGMVRQARVLARRYLKKHATARADGG